MKLVSVGEQTQIRSTPNDANIKHTQNYNCNNIKMGVSIKHGQAQYCPVEHPRIKRYKKLHFTLREKIVAVCFQETLFGDIQRYPCKQLKLKIWLQFVRENERGLTLLTLCFAVHMSETAYNLSISSSHGKLCKRITICSIYLLSNINVTKDKIHTTVQQLPCLFYTPW